MSPATPAARSTDHAVPEHVPEHVHDLVGIGLGPFGLGLAALSDPVPDLDAVFLDAADGFRWHPGMMIEGATIQVPFLADLVTMADPTSRFSFLSWLKQAGRLYPFYVRESFFPLRAEYDAYCRWVADQLDTLRWGRRVTAVTDLGDGTLLVQADRAPGGSPAGGSDPAAGTDPARIGSPSGQAGSETWRTRHVVLSTGTEPAVPSHLTGLDGPVVHSADYLGARDELRAAPSVTIVGSGQSAAEIYRDLLDVVGADPGLDGRPHDPGPASPDDCHDRHGPARGSRLDWITRSPRFFAMEYTKLTLELTSPEYTDHFHGLPLAERDRLGREQRSLYKGISGDLVDDIHETLYRRSVDGPLDTTLLTETELVDAAWHADRGLFSLTLRHAQLGTTTVRETAALVLATGYAPRSTSVLDPLGDQVERDARGRLAVARDHSVDGGRGRVFVQNGEEHTHGLTAPDLGMGAWRSSSIIASVTGREVYPLERRVAFQTFGLPGGEARVGPPGARDAEGATVR
jgi:lysine N6-hydroxylase